MANLLRMEQNDIQIARALGIRAAQEDLGCDSVLDSPEMRELCSGRENQGVKMLVGAFVDGWNGRACPYCEQQATFQTQEEPQHTA